MGFFRHNFGPMWTLLNRLGPTSRNQFEGANAKTMKRQTMLKRCAADSSDDSDSDILVDNTDADEGSAYEDEELAYEDEDVSAEDEDDTNPTPSTGSQLGGALGKQLGNLLEKGLNDLFR